MAKGKTHRRSARQNIMRANAANARRKARQQARQYDRTRYDGSQPEGESAL